jgi:prolipoprotein diacylglyceryltransferase
MKFFRSGLIELMIFVAVVAVLIALHSSRLDKGLAIAWMLLLVAGSARLIYKSGVHRNDPVASSRAFTGRWSSVLLVAAGILVEISTRVGALVNS